MWTSINNWVAANALGFSMMFGALKNFTADYVIQTKFENKKQVGETNNLNYHRMAVFTSFGLLYVGGAQYIILNRILPRFLPGLLEGQIRPAAKAVVFDQIFHMPFLYLPVFYIFREFGNQQLDKYSMLSNSKAEFYDRIVQPAYVSWKNSFSADMLIEMSIFVPVQALNFTIIKPHFRVPFLTCFGFLWVMTLSYRRGSEMTVEDGAKEEL
eukprot:g3293.t1